MRSNEPSSGSRSNEVVSASVSTHVKARVERPDSYPVRTAVPERCVSWSVPLADYLPTEFTSPHVIAKDRTQDPTNPSLWADPSDPALVRAGMESFEGQLLFEGDRPLNPRGRTGISGRGELGCWGPNIAADPIVTRLNPLTGVVEAILIERRDSGELAIPGGMRDRTDPHISATLARELSEETGAAVDFSRARILYRGYVDDRRNTDNAWMETTVSHIHLSSEQAANVRLVAGDDARPGSARWVPLTPEILDRMYASHGEFLRRAIATVLPDTE